MTVCPTCGRDRRIDLSWTCGFCGHKEDADCVLVERDALKAKLDAIHEALDAFPNGDLTDLGRFFNAVKAALEKST